MQRDIPDRQHSTILPSRVANHSTWFGSCGQVAVLTILSFCNQMQCYWIAWTKWTANWMKLKGLLTMSKGHWTNLLNSCNVNWLVECRCRSVFPSALSSPVCVPVNTERYFFGMKKMEKYLYLDLWKLCRISGKTFAPTCRWWRPLRCLKSQGGFRQEVSGANSPGAWLPCSWYQAGS